MKMWSAGHNHAGFDTQQQSGACCCVWFLVSCGGGFNDFSVSRRSLVTNLVFELGWGWVPRA